MNCTNWQPKNKFPTGIFITSGRWATRSCDCVNCNALICFLNLIFIYFNWLFNHRFGISLKLFNYFSVNNSLTDRINRCVKHLSLGNSAPSSSNHACSSVVPHYLRYSWKNSWRWKHCRICSSASLNFLIFGQLNSSFFDRHVNIYIFFLQRGWDISTFLILFTTYIFCRYCRLLIQLAFLPSHSI